MEKHTSQGEQVQKRIVRAPMPLAGPKKHIKNMISAMFQMKKKLQQSGAREKSNHAKGYTHIILTGSQKRQVSKEKKRRRKQSWCRSAKPQ